MSICLIVLPVLSAGISSLGPAFGSAAVNLGFHLVQSHREQIEQAKIESIEIILENSEIQTEQFAKQKEYTYQKDDVIMVFSVTERNQAKLQVYGKNKTKKELHQIGNEMIHQLTRQYTYNKLLTVLKEKGYSVLAESIEPNDSVRLQVRRFDKKNQSSRLKQELELELNRDNKINLEVKGVKGKSCVNMAEEIVELIGKEESRVYTSDYYQPEPSVWITEKQKINR